MATRRSWWRIALYLAAIPVAIVLLAYLYVAFAPSPGAQFLEGQREEAVESAREIIGCELSSASLHPAIGHPKSGSVAISETRRSIQPQTDASPPDLFAQILAFERKWERVLYAVRVEYRKAFPTRTGDFLMWEIPPTMAADGSLTTNPVDLRKLPKKDIQKSVLPLARDIVVVQQDYGIPADLGLATGPTSSTMNLGPYLAGIEEILLGKWNLPDPNQPPRPIPYHRFAESAWLTVDAAVRKGDGKKAGELAERTLEFLRLNRALELTDGEEFLDAASNLDLLSRRNAFTADALGRMAAVLERCRLSPKDLQNLRVLQSLQVRRALYRMGYTGWRSEDNSWHRFAGGVPEKIVRYVARPIWRRQVDQFLSSHTQGDLGRASRTANWLGATRYILINARPYDRLPLSTWTAFDRDGRDEELSEASPVFEVPDLGAFSEATDLASLAVATIRLRLDGTSHPDLEGLAPYYLDANALQTEDAAWEILSLPSFSYPKITDLPSTHPFLWAFRRYTDLTNYPDAGDLRREGSWPRTPESLARFAPDGSDTSDFSRHFVQSGDRLVFCRLHKHRYVSGDGLLTKGTLAIHVRAQIYVLNAAHNNPLLPSFVWNGKNPNWR